MKRERHAVMTHNSVEIEIQKIKKNKKKIPSANYLWY